jgi:molecular chaperone HscC
VIIGIDLGTTNSAVAVWRDGRSELIPNALGNLLTPSAVGLDGNGELIVGLAARERQSTHPHLTATNFKRYMGTQRVSELGGRIFLPEDLSALVLSRLRADAEAHLDERVTEAVITVPAYFNDKQRKATKRAGELAGLKVERLLNEPTAAALAYGIHKLDDNSRFLVFDLGGGTFDVSVLEIFEGVIEVQASTGDNRLGGEDFNALLVDHMVSRYSNSWGKSVQDEQLLGRVRAAAERAKRALTDASATEISVVWNGESYTLEITSDMLESLAAPLIARLREPVLRALRDSAVTQSDLKEIVLVGGATRMPIVRRAATKMFGRFPANAVHPDHAVALGAGVQAGLKRRDAALKEVVLTDVCPYSLGVDTGERGANGVLRHGIFSPIIERNTPVPASRVKLFTTLQDGQRQVVFGIFQGESRRVSDNINLGRVEVPIPPARQGEVWVECRFSYDINGLIEIDVLVPSTDERRHLTIVDDDVDPFDLEKRRQALSALKVHPRDSEANRTALARAERCYEESLGDRREYINQLIRTFEAALDTQDPRRAEQERQALASELDALEGATFL